MRATIPIILALTTCLAGCDLGRSTRAEPRELREVAGFESVLLPDLQLGEEWHLFTGHRSGPPVGSAPPEASVSESLVLLDTTRADALSWVVSAAWLLPEDPLITWTATADLRVHLDTCWEFPVWYADETQPGTFHWLGSHAAPELQAVGVAACRAERGVLRIVIAGAMDRAWSASERAEWIERLSESLDPGRLPEPPRIDARARVDEFGDLASLFFGDHPLSRILGPPGLPVTHAYLDLRDSLCALRPSLFS